ncbi:MAG: glycoside hydrolase [Lachnoclostridium sp.]|nr:glycoside hydrolase [Lachnoclostridium sp.]
MKKNRLFAAALAACLLTQPCMTALADEAKGPGYDRVVETDVQGPGAKLTPWVKTASGYVDDAGNVIEGAVLRGVSVSKWQGDVNWGKVAADDISFALIRMGSFGYEGEYTMDPTYDTNMREAKANGVHTTPYVYLQTRTVEEAKAAARYALEKAVPYDITYPLAVDVESQYIMDLSKQELTDVVNAFCQVIEEAGYTPIIYSSHNYFTTEMDIEQFKYDLWVARYGGDHNLKGRTMWQSTDSGKVNGINGNVCLEFAFKDYAAMQVTDRSDYTPGTWEKIDDIWYFAHETGYYTGWVKPDGNWYYLDPANGGAMLANTTAVIDGVTYSFGPSGALQ